MVDQSRPMQGRRVLVVEDEWFIVVELVEFLKANGAIVVGPVSNLADGLDLATGADALDGAILNIAVRDRYSYPIADVLRERGVPFVFATGIERFAIPRAYANVPHIRKPYEASSLVSALFDQQHRQDGPA